MAIPRNLANIAPHANASSTEFVINDGSADLDFRVESDGNTSMLFVDAGNNRVGIGTGTPQVLLNVDNGNGDGTLRFGGGAGLDITHGNASQISEIKTLYATTSSNVQLKLTSGFTTFHTGTSGTERMRIDSSGNVGIGTNNPTVKFQIEGTIPEINFISYSDTNNYGVTHRYRMAKGSVSSPTTVANGNELYTLIAQGYDGSGFRSAASIRVNVDNTVGANDMPGRIGFFTTSDGSDSDTERARITSGGYFKASNSGAYGDSTGSFHELYQTATGTNCANFRSSSGSYTATVIGIQCDRNTTNGSYNFLTCSTPGVETKLVIADSGNVTNKNGSYGTISDVKLKQDIVDASSQWDDIKNLRFRKYRLKSDVEVNPNAKPLLGLVAQEAELVSPGLIEEQKDIKEEVKTREIQKTREVTPAVLDEEGNIVESAVTETYTGTEEYTEIVDLGTTTKSIKTSVLYMKAVKALQEAITRIETLEAEVAALKAK